MNGGTAALQQLLFFALLIAGLYFLAIRPQRKRAQALAEVRAGLTVGARVMTAGGLHGTVVALEGDTVLIEIAPGVPVRFTTNAVLQLLEEAAPPGEPPPAADGRGA